jgi:sterol desaturase/sphingolipid hydroxylase (fatty acid hydroxylase superfamily)
MVEIIELGVNEMEINFFALAIPFFIILIAIEYKVAKVLNKAVYELKDFASSISCGLLEEAFCLPLQGFLIFGYYYIYQHYALFYIDSKSVYSWILLWLGADFLYYWYHRASHRNNFLWMGHSVHHQSEYFNFSTAIRQGIVQTLFTWIIYLPLALLGFPTWMFVTVTSLVTLYQFWIHTQLINRLGWFEFLFNTPSHHRVHHGINPQYIDKNYGGSLMIWDRLFGTYEKEVEPVVYGVTEPLNSWNPFYANIKVIADGFYYGKFLSSIKEKILIFFRPPEWIINHLGKEKFQESKRKITTLSPVSYSKAYVFINTSIAIFSYCYFFMNFDNSSLLTVLSGAFVFSTLLQIALVIKYGESRTINLIELLRSVLVISVAHLLFKNYQIDLGLVLLIVILLVYMKKPSKALEAVLQDRLFSRKQQ